MGLYPDLPGSDRYSLGSPVFERIEIDLGTSVFVIDAVGARGRPYVREVTLDGVPLDRRFIRHAHLVGGSTLKLTMSDSHE